MKVSRLTRRQALAKLGVAPVALYVAPAVSTLSSAARASGASKASDPTVPTPPTPPSNPSGPETGNKSEADESASDHCQVDTGEMSTQRAPSISAEDYSRAQASVDAGYAKPLNQIWVGIMEQYPGKIVSVTFTGFQFRPRYRLRAISQTGRLETVIVSARTGDIVRIVGC